MQARWWHDRLLLALMLLLVWLPIPLGSNRMPAWSLAGIWLAGLLVVWLVQYLRGRREMPVTCVRAWPLLVLLGLWCAYLALQITPLPPALVGWLSPQSLWLHHLAYDPAGADRWLTLSVEPFATRVALQKSLAYWALAWLVLLLVDDHRRLRWLAYSLVVAGLLQVVIAVTAVPPDSSLLDAQVRASFANRNHLANYLTLCLALGLGLLLAGVRDRRAANAGESLRRALDWLMSGRMRLRVALLLMATVIVLTRSRMGNVAFFGSMLLAGSLMLLLVRERRRGVVLLLASLIAIDILIVGSLVGVDRVVERLEDTSLAAETRDEVARDTLAYWRDFPLTGSGLGTFYVTFPRYRQADVPLFYRRAHNDYLQFGAETGAIGVLLVGGALALSLLTAVNTLRRRRDPLALGIAFAVVMATSAVLVHASVEFNLQIYANAATFVCILALAWVAAHLPRAPAPPTARPRPRPVRIAAQAMILGLVAYSGWVAATAAADLISDSNARALRQWRAAGAVDPDRVRVRMRRQIDAIHLAPGNADAKLVLSRLSWWQLRGRDDDPAAADGVHAQMLYALLDAARDNPGLANTWVSIATVRHFQGRYDALFQAALAQAERLAPWEPHVQRAVARTGLAAWERLRVPAQRALVLAAIERGLISEPAAMTALVERSGRRAQICAQLSGAAAAPLCPAPATAGGD